jgi:hypothetical protein
MACILLFYGQYGCRCTTANIGVIEAVTKKETGKWISGALHEKKDGISIGDDDG